MNLPQDRRRQDPEGHGYDQLVVPRPINLHPQQLPMIGNGPIGYYRHAQQRAVGRAQGPEGGSRYCIPMTKFLFILTIIFSSTMLFFIFVFLVVEALKQLQDRQHRGSSEVTQLI